MMLSHIYHEDEEQEKVNITTYLSLSVIIKSLNIPFVPWLSC